MTVDDVMESDEFPKMLDWMLQSFLSDQEKENDCTLSYYEYTTESVYHVTIEGNIAKSMGLDVPYTKNMSISKKSIRHAIFCMLRMNKLNTLLDGD